MDADIYTTMGTEPQNTEAVLAKLIEALEHNGDLSESEHRRLTLLAITGLYYIIMPLPAKVRKLESSNIVIWIQKHQKITCTILVIVALMAMFLNDVGNWIIHNLGILASFKP